MSNDDVVLEDVATAAATILTAAQVAPAQTQPPSRTSTLSQVVDRLPEVLGFSPEHARHLPTWAHDMVLGSVGRFIEFHVYGLTLFEAKSPWAYAGVDVKSLRAAQIKNQPYWYLYDTTADKGILDPFHLIKNLIRNLSTRYHGIWIPERSCWYFTYRAEAMLVEAFQAHRVKHNEHREKLIEALPGIRERGEQSVTATAREAYVSLREFDTEWTEARLVNAVREWHARNFPTPTIIRDRLKISMDDKLRPDEYPSPQIIETVLGLKEAIDEETRAQRATADKAEAESGLVRQQLELIQLQTSAERDAVNAMIARRLQLEDERLKEEADRNVMPLIALMRNAHETIGVAITEAYEKIKAGKDLTPSDVKRLRRTISAYQMVSANEVDLDARVAELEAVIKTSRSNRNAKKLETTLEEIMKITAADVARIHAADEQQIGGLFAFMGETTRKEVADGEENN